MRKVDTHTHTHVHSHIMASSGEFDVSHSVIFVFCCRSQVSLNAGLDFSEEVAAGLVPSHLSAPANDLCKFPCVCSGLQIQTSNSSFQSVSFCLNKDNKDVINPNCLVSFPHFLGQSTAAFAAFGSNLHVHAKADPGSVGLPGDAAPGPFYGHVASDWPAPGARS